MVDGEVWRIKEKHHRQLLAFVCTVVLSVELVVNRKILNQSGVVFYRTNLMVRV